MKKNNALTVSLPIVMGLLMLCASAETKAATTSITSPANGATVSTTFNLEFTMSGMVSGSAVQHVHVYKFAAGGSPSGYTSVYASPYSVSGLVAGQTYTIRIIPANSGHTEDVSGKTDINVTAQAAGAPSIDITSPAANANVALPFSLQFSVSNFTLSQGQSKVYRWYVDGVEKGSGATTSAISVTSAHITGEGSKTIAIKLFEGGIEKASDSVTVNVTTASAPTVTIQTPSAGATLGTGFSLQFVSSGWEMAQGGKHARWFLDGTEKGQVYNTDAIAVTNVTPGAHTLAVTLYEGNGTSQGTSASVNVTVVADEQAPSVQITSPKTGADVTTPLTLRYEVDNWTMAEGGKSVHIFADGSDLGAHYTSPELVAIPDLAVGSHTLAAKLHDGTSFTGVETTITVNVTGAATTEENEQTNKGGCASTGSQGGAWILGLTLIALVLRRRRRI